MLNVAIHWCFVWKKSWFILASSSMSYIISLGYGLLKTSCVQCITNTFVLQILPPGWIWGWISATTPVIPRHSWLIIWLMLFYSKLQFCHVVYIFRGWINRSLLRFQRYGYCFLLDPSAVFSGLHHTICSLMFSNKYQRPSKNNYMCPENKLLHLLVMKATSKWWRQLVQVDFVGFILGLHYIQVYLLGTG